MKIRKVIVAVLCGVTLALAALAGWQHTVGGTTWIDRPTPATYWLRDNRGYLYINPHPVVDYQTVKEVYANLASTAPVLKESFGYWNATNATCGMLSIRSDLTLADALACNGSVAGVYDIEWMVKTDGTNWWLCIRP